MGYGVSAYAVDLDRLLGAIGSRDKALAAQVQKQALDRIEGYELSNTPGHLGKAIERLIDGDFDNLGAFHKYDLGYALECLVLFLAGREIYGDDSLKSLSGQWLYDQPVVKELVGSQSASLARKMPLPNEFPGIHVVPVEEIPAKIDAVKAVADAPDDDLRGACADYLWFLETAQDKGRALITFYY